MIEITTRSSTSVNPLFFRLTIEGPLSMRGTLSERQRRAVIRVFHARTVGAGHDPTMEQ